MLDRLPSLPHLFRMFVEPALHCLEKVLMLPSRDPSLLAGSTALLDGAALTGIGPIASQCEPCDATVEQADPNAAEQNQLQHAKQQLALAQQYPGRERSLPSAKVTSKR
jgi:hypothetical protein